MHLHDVMTSPHRITSSVLLPPLLQAAGQRVTEVIVCPLCAKGVRLQPGQDPNVAFDQHAASTACDPRNYAKVRVYGTGSGGTSSVRAARARTGHIPLPKVFPGPFPRSEIV